MLYSKENLQEMKFTLLMNNFASLFHFLFTQAIQQCMVGAAFINGLIVAL